MQKHIFQKMDIKADDAFLKEFADMYVKQRTDSLTPVKDLTMSFGFKSTDFDTSKLEEIIKRNVIAEDKKREAGETPSVLNDIYRSDLGELLLTYYFEEKIDTSLRFKIPAKNITTRELSHLPGRGMDAIGYRRKSDKINLLLGEAKVSESIDSPPSVVHTSSDSIFSTHSKHKDNKKETLKKLSEYYKRLTSVDAVNIGFAIWAIENNIDEHYEITFGCVLIRDYSCLNAKTDYGKMKSEVKSFEPHNVHFGLLSFKDKKISDVVGLFYKEVYKIAA